MAKELPYFQFEPAEYLTGDISFCSLSAQGLFTILCSYYWQRSCKLTKEQFLKRINNPKEFKELVDENVIQLDGSNIKINFLDEQLNKVTKQSKTNSVNGSKGGRPKKQKPIETEIKPKQKPIETETKGIREDDIRKEEIKEDDIDLAIDFLKLNKRSQYDIFYMQNKNNVHEWQRMLDSFNDQVDLEVAQNKISFNTDELLPRLKKYCRSWISNQKPDSSNPKEIKNPNNERIIIYNDNVNPTERKILESKFKVLEENGKGGGYIYKILRYE